MNTNEYASRLKNLQTDIIAELNTIATQDPTTGDWQTKSDIQEQPETDENSEADAAETLSTDTGIVTHLEKTYRSINRALEHISNNTYGLCEVCSQPIELTRLDIIPYARTCIAHRDQEQTLAL